MGCDCHIYLPDNARLRDVCEVMAALLGFEKKWEESDDRRSHWAKVEGVSARVCDSTPEMLTLSGELPEDSPARQVRDDAPAFSAFWHWEGTPGFHLLSVRSTSFWITIGKKLVDFFGGYVDFNDCDNKDEDYQKKVKTNKQNCPEDGKAWNTFQDRIMNIVPITLEEYYTSIKQSGYQV